MAGHNRICAQRWAGAQPRPTAACIELGRWILHGTTRYCHTPSAASPLPECRDAVLDAPLARVYAAPRRAYAVPCALPPPHKLGIPPRLSPPSASRSSLTAEEERVVEPRAVWVEAHRGDAEQHVLTVALADAEDGRCPLRPQGHLDDDEVHSRPSASSPRRSTMTRSDEDCCASSLHRSTTARPPSVQLCVPTQIDEEEDCSQLARALPHPNHRVLACGKSNNILQGEQSKGKEKGRKGLGFLNSEQNLHDLCSLLEGNFKEVPGGSLSTTRLKIQALAPLLAGG